MPLGQRDHLGGDVHAVYVVEVVCEGEGEPPHPTAEVERAFAAALQAQLVHVPENVAYLPLPGGEELRIVPAPRGAQDVELRILASGGIPPFPKSLQVIH
jgi:hypothetical protein